MRLCAVLVATWCCQVRADDLASARHFYQRGTAYYDVGKFNEALDAFQQAHLAHPDAAFLYNIAQCHRALQDFGAAAREYRAYLRNVEKPPHRQEVLRLIAEMDRAQQEKNERLRAEQVRPQVSVPETPVAVVVAPPAPPPAKPNAAGWALTSLGAGALLAGVGTLGYMGAISAQANGPLETFDIHSKVMTLSIAGGITVGVGAALLVGGIARFALRRRGVR
jgi:tetratricopeptide (TPR) repeat protein